MTSREYFRRVLFTLLATTIFVSVALFIWLVIDVVLLIFVGFLLAVLFRTLALPLHRYTPLSEGWSLAIVMLLLVLFLVGFMWLVIPQLIAQVGLLMEAVPDALEQLTETLAQYEWGELLLGALGSDVLTPAAPEGGFFGTFSSTFDILTHGLFIVFIGIFAAINPQEYVNGTVKLFPRHHRRRARDVIDELGSTLRWWLVGRLISMVIIGTVTGLGLWLLGMPLALALGLLSGTFEFVPLLGPIVASLPGILLAFVEGPTMAIYVTLMYLAIQQLEGNIVTPLVQKQTVHLPPVVTLASLLIMSAAFGVVGLLVATPLTALLMVIVKMLYIEDRLHEEVELPGDRKDKDETKNGESAASLSPQVTITD